MGNPQQHGVGIDDTVDQAGRSEAKLSLTLQHLRSGNEEESVLRHRSLP